MTPFPAGTIIVTFLFTDIEGSMRHWEQQPGAMQPAVARHDEVLRTAIEAHGGHVFKTIGDAFCAAFAAAPDALAAALHAQRAIAAHEWSGIDALRVRMALYTGAVQARDGDYFGQPLNRVARLIAATHGGQILLGHATQEMVRDSLPEGVGLRDLGEHRLKDMAEPERFYQLVGAGLPDNFPPLKSINNRPNNLPAQLTPLVGRKKEVEDARNLLRRDDVHLLTLVGPGGTGKTRLSLEVAAGLLDDCEDGVFQVALAPITDPALVASAVAQALDVKEVAGQPLLDTLKAYLREKKLLLVLDNFEQIITAAPLVAALLTACPQLKVLATSRIALRVGGEYEFPVPPLELPNRRPPPPLEIMTQYAAVQLFVERAQAVKPDFAVTNDNAPAVAEICHRLDGLPLAIELAAARIKLLPPHAMLQRLESRLDLLTGGPRDRPERQQTLRAAMAWGYDLLEAGEQALFRRLAVFTGSCTLEAAEAVCASAGDVAEDMAIDVFEAVSSLMDKSLLWQQETEDEPRFFMLETIREFGLENLQKSGEEAALRQHHARFFLALAEAAYPKLLGSPEQRKWIECLEREQDNLRAALWWLVDKEPAIGLRLAMMLARFWRLAGRDIELRESLERALEQGGEAPAQVRIIALRELGEVLLRLGAQTEIGEHDNYERAMQLLEESAALCRQAGDLQNLAWTLRKLGEGAQYTGNDLEKARAYQEESLTIERARGDKVALGNALMYVSSLARDTGDLETAHAHYEEAVALYREINHPIGVARSLVQLAGLAYMQDDTALARSYWEQSLPVFRDFKEKAALLWALRWLGELAFAHGDYEAARALNEEHLLLGREMESSEEVLRALWRLAKVSRQEGHYPEARCLFGQAMLTARDSGNKMYLHHLLVDFAQLAAAQRQWQRAACLSGSVDALRQAAPLWQPYQVAHDSNIAATRAALGEETFESLFAQGRAMTSEQAVQYALQDASDD
ncbi:MAG TPA: tetratricopeptide repeat protein [Abditibacteriaceae bacterium]|nr:tetratricopeptide repeat protein [Abditibacteriaceae bacterium]